MRFLFLFLSITFTLSLNAQTSVTIVYQSDDQLISEIIQKYREYSCTKENCEDLINHITRELANEGYIEAELEFHENKGIAELKPGRRFLMINTGMEGIPESFQPEAIRLLGDNQPFREEEIHRFSDDIIKHFEQLGYPFCKVNFSTEKIIGSFIQGKFTVDVGKEMMFGKVTSSGSVLSEKWLSAYTGITVGEKYDQRKINLLNPSFKSLGYQIQGDISIVYDSSFAQVNIPLKRQEKGLFDGLMGGYYSQELNKTVLMGYLNLLIPELFDTPKSLKIEWNRLRVNTQRMHIKYQHQALFKKKLNGELEFELFKADSSFSNVRFSGGLFSPISPVAAMQFLGVLEQGSLVENPSYIENKLQFIDQQSVWAGLGFQTFFTTLNVHLSTYVGRRALQDNPDIPDAYLMEIDSKETHVKVIGEATYNKMLRSRLETSHHLNLGGVFGPTIFRNEMFMLGGISNIRGFKENEFFTPKYLYLNSELKWNLLDEGTYLFVFSDKAILEMEGVPNFYFSFGGGGNLKAGKGMLQLVLAYGKEAGERINLGESLLHVGYIVNF